MTYLYIARYFHPVAEHTFVADLSVMSDMALSQNKALASDQGLAPLVDTAVDDHLFADLVVVADYHVGFFTFPAEILRSGRDYRSLIDFIVLADTGTGKDAGMGMYMASGIDDNIGVDIRESVYHYIVSQACTGMNISEITDFSHTI